MAKRVAFTGQESGRFKVAITGLLMMPDSEKRKGIVWTGREPQ